MIRPGFLALLLVPALARGQDLAQRPSLAPALAQLRAANDWTLGQQISLCEIPAHTLR